VKDTCGVEPIVVYLDFRALQPISTEDLAHVGVLLRPEDDEACVWDGDAPTVLKACIGVEGEDLSVAARAALRELHAVLLQAGLAGETRKVVSCSEEAQLVVEGRRGAELQGLVRRCGQTYCDWCMGPLTSQSIIDSERLGLHHEFAWACTACLAKDNYHRAPDGWEPPEYEWPYRDS
jgi:hypothetical protein